MKCQTFSAISVLGIKLSTLAYCIIGIVGAGLFAIGGVVNIFWLMLMGRLIFGLGNELATGVCVNYCIFSWYRNSIMNLVSSLSNDGTIVGTVLIFQMGPRLLSNLENYFSERKSLDIVIVSASGLFVVTSAFAILMTYLKPRVSSETDLSSDPVSHHVAEKKTATLKDIITFPPVFWLLCLLNCFYCALNCFYQFSQGLLTSDEFRLTEEEASNSVTAMSVIKIVLSIPISLSVDIIGRNTWYIIIAQIIGTLAYFLFTLRINPYAGMILVGLSNSIFNAAIVPMFAYPMEKHLIGSCYGIMSAAGGLSLFGAPLIIGSIIDKYSYGGAIIFYFVASCTCLLIILIIWILDKRSTGILSMTPSQRIHFEYRLEKIRNRKKTGNDQNTGDFSTTLASNIIR